MIWRRILTSFLYRNGFWGEKYERERIYVG
jgi:hypothetical protein